MKKFTPEKRKLRIDVEALIKFRKECEEKHITSDDIEYTAKQAEPLFTDEPPTPRNTLRR